MMKRRQTPYQMQKSAAAWAAQVNNNRHLEVEVAEADSHKLIQMLFAALVSHLENAERGLLRSDFASKTKWLSKSQACISEARGALRHDVNPELSANLFSLYEYAEQLIIKAKLKPLTDEGNKEGIALVIECRDLMLPLKEAWDETAEEARTFRAELLEKQQQIIAEAAAAENKDGTQP